MSDRARPMRRSPLALVATMVVVGVAVVALPRDGGDRGDGPAAPAPSADPTAVLPTAAAVIAPSEEAFCARFRTLAGVQGQYVAQSDGTGAALLRDELDDILTVGVPDSMGIPARTGYFLELSGMYESLGERLDPRAVQGAVDGAGEASLPAPSAAFGQWLADFCPAW